MNRVADGIFSRIISKKKNVYKVINHNENFESFLIKVNNTFSHGKTIKEAKESLIYKVSERDTSRYKDLKLDTKLTFEESIKMYITITGACESGTKYFVKNNIKDKDKKYSISEILELTKHQFGNNTLKNFFE